MPTATLERSKPKDPPVLGKTEPRIWTKPLAENLDEHGELFGGTFDEDCEHEDCDCWSDRATDGYAAIAFAEDILGVALFPWQRWLLIHALELIDDGFGGKVYRFRIVIVSVARQNGKTVIATILALWHMFGRADSVGKTIIGTAQDLSKADDTWQDAVTMAEACEELIDEFRAEDIFRGHPKTFTTLDGCEYRVASATRRGGRGFSGDLIILDELREHQNWESWSAVTNTMNARPRAQAVAFSNAGDATSVVLRYQRAIAHRALEWPDGMDEFDGVLDAMDDEIAEMLAEMDDLNPGWFEWSAPPGAKRNDLTALAQSNPSVNHVEIAMDCPTTRTLLTALASRPAYEYETEVMCRWATMGVGGPYPEGSWLATLDEEKKYRPADSSKKVVCVEVSEKRSQAYITRAGITEDGIPVVAMRYDHPGTDWILKSLKADVKSTDLVVVRADPGSNSLTVFNELERELHGVEVRAWKGADVGVAHALVIDKLRHNGIRHYPHGGLDIAATSAMEIIKPGGASTIDIKRSPTDVAPLLAAEGALWGLHELTANDYELEDSIL